MSPASSGFPEPAVLAIVLDITDRAVAEQERQRARFRVEVGSAHTRLLSDDTINT